MCVMTSSCLAVGWPLWCPLSCVTPRRAAICPSPVCLLSGGLSCLLVGQSCGGETLMAPSKDCADDPEALEPAKLALDLVPPSPCVVHTWRWMERVFNIKHKQGTNGCQTAPLSQA